MTREEAIELSPLNSEMMVLINKIYNDFESRTCVNCKWFNQSYKVYGECSCDISEVNINDSVLVHKTFGCNKFEREQ